MLLVVILAIVAIAKGDTGENGINIFFLVLGLVSLALRGLAVGLIRRAKRSASNPTTQSPSPIEKPLP
ncbi:MAG: hypothetical protein H7226_03360 [Salinibacterium sp.]|nr:hypothetical protein [Salinibacterium sp.]